MIGYVYSNWIFISYFEALFNYLEPCCILLDACQICGTLSNILGRCLTFWSFVLHFGALSSILGLCLVFWGLV